MVSRATPQQQKLAAGFGAIGTVVAGIAIVLFLAPRYLRDRGEAALYSVAADCAADTRAKPCRQKSLATVAQLFTRPCGRSRCLWIAVRLGDGATLDAQLPYREVWSAASRSKSSSSPAR